MIRCTCKILFVTLSYYIFYVVFLLRRLIAFGSRFCSMNDKRSGSDTDKAGAEGPQFAVLFESELCAMVFSQNKNFSSKSSDLRAMRCLIV